MSALGTSTAGSAARARPQMAMPAPINVSVVAPQKPRSRRAPVISRDTTATYTGEPADSAATVIGSVRNSPKL